MAREKPEGTILTDFQTGEKYIRYKNGSTEKLMDEQAPPGVGNWYAPDPSAYSVVPPNQPGPLAGTEPVSSTNSPHELVPASPPYGDVFSTPIYPQARGGGPGQITRNPPATVPATLGNLETGPADFTKVGMAGDTAAPLGPGNSDFPLTQGTLNSPPLPTPIVNPPDGATPPQGPAPGGNAPPIGQSLQPGSIKHGPPASDEEFQQRVKGWAAFGDRLKSDPQLQQALFYLGAQIVQPRYGGQTTLGRLGTAGVGTLNFMNESAKEQNQSEVQQQKLALDKRAQSESEAKSGAQIESLKAATQKLQAEIKFLPEEQRAAIMKDAAQAAEMISRGNYQDAHAALARAQAKLEGDPRYVSAKINELNAQAAHYRQAAATTGLTTHERDAEAITKSKVKDPNWRPEITDKGLREAQARSEAWQSLEPGGVKEMAARASAEDLAGAADRAYEAAVAGGDKEAKKLAPNLWKQRWLGEQNLMMGFDKAALTKAMGLIGGKPPGTVGAQGGAGPAKDLKGKVKLNQKVGPYPAGTIGEYRDGKFYPDEVQEPAGMTP